MGDHEQLRTVLVVFLFLVPAAVSLLFTWFVWTANKRPAISAWRLATFRWGLFLASATYALFVISGYHLLRTLEPASGFWLMANWFGIGLWALSTLGAIFGRGSGRILLLCWAALTFCGVLGISSVMIP